MPRQNNRTVNPASASSPAKTGAPGARPLPPADSAPRDWRDLGRRVLAEALRQAMDELQRRHASTPASVVPHLSQNGVARARRRSEGLS